MNQELTSRIRTILLLAAQDEQNKITPKDIMNKFECSIEDAIKYLEIIESHHWGKSEAVHVNSENQGWLTLNHNGMQEAEDMRNEDRWKNVLQVCNAIDNYSLNAAINILGQRISYDIHNEIVKQPITE